MITCFINLLLCIGFLSASDPIVIDCLWNDWDSIPIAVIDEEGDYNGDDWAELKISNDHEFLFLKILLHSEETLLQNWNNFHLFIDADFDSLTGRPFRGVGAELEWHFGERAGQYFDIVGGSPVMMREGKVLKNDFPAITHIDGSARVQTVTDKVNESLYKLIKAFDKVSGFPVILNTSFNLPGEPIVESPTDALNSFSNGSLEYLCLGNYLVSRNSRSAKS